MVISSNTVASDSRCLIFAAKIVLVLSRDAGPVVSLQT